MSWSIKGVNRLASAAFSPDGDYMAAGTMAGAVDLQFSSSANLDIFNVDFKSDKQFALAGTAQSSERFDRISWSKGTPNSEEYSLGLIAGGLVDGNIGLWNPNHLIRSETSDKAFVSNLSRHKGPVRGLEFNSITPNLLASGADEGDICIWDVAKPSEPSHFPPLKGSGSATQGEISYLSWNSKVQHILASTSYNGTTVVWDLKKQKPVLSFPDPVRRRCSVLQWNPDIATQLIVASDEDSSPSLRLWDMRNIMSPVKEFVGHTKGVIAMSWCPFDSSYLLTCAKDNRTICWDTVSGEIVGELPSGSNRNFDVQWYSKIPGVISASSFDGKIGIYNVEGCGRYGAAENGINTVSFRAPKWYKRKAGVSFGFGGKLISFNSLESPSKSSEVYVNTLVTEKGLVGRSSEFEAAIQNGERSALKVFCDRKSQESESEEEKETWNFMKVMFAEDGSARSNLLTHLGFKLPAEESDTVQDGLSDQVKALGLDEGMANTEDVSEKKESVLFSMDNGEDFFNNLPSPKAETPVATSKNDFVNNDPVNLPQEEVNGQEESADPAFDDAVQHALVVGDYKGAVKQCISAGKLADALAIANVGGPSLWESTLDQFLKTSHSPYLKILGAMVNKDLMSIANTRPLKSWKETLALFCTFAQTEEWTLLCDTLASRLVAGGNTAAATLCYICAGNIDKAVEMWSKDLAIEQEGKTYVDRLQDLMEKTIVFALATGQKQFSASLCRLVEKYAEILASQGLLNTAMEYLNLLGTGELSTELTILRDRIARSTESEKEVSQTYTYENSKVQTGSSYSVDQRGYGVADPSQRYYPETMAPQMQQTVPNSPYSDNYQQFNRGYSNPGTYQPTPQPNTQYQPTPQLNTQYQPTPQPNTQYQPTPQLNTQYQPTPQLNTQYQPTPQPNTQYQPTPQLNTQYQPTPQPNTQHQQPAMFLPSPANPAPVANFPLPPLNTQAPAKFVPANPPTLKNVEQYLQPSLGSQLYPNPIHQSGSPGVPGYGATPGPRMPQVLPTPQHRGFMPVNNPGVARPGMSPVQPSSPTQPAPMQAVAAPAAPPPTIQTVDTSNVPAQQKPVIATLTRLFNETSEALGGSRANPAKRREIEDNSKKLGALFAKLNSSDISKNAAEKLVQLCQALDHGDFATALQIQVQLTTSDWDECNFWLATLKRMIKARQNVR